MERQGDKDENRVRERKAEKLSGRENKDFVSNAFSSIRDKKEYPINTPYNCLQTFFFI